ncbi:F-box/FBD/LRR-repeat protein At1g13570-like [Rosa rugosa]|uniref:F-box/FBD/LRR-repeat protein At1g13570-like n=1 Tax=Rosa rugosa TaxID=74645 RepID=UPI002B40F132|nr:F-box/FBD/LRR-repeat protein At1g13570-like [Rosa rugosa]
MDRLSNFPDELVDKILCILPIQQAVKTCVLSSTWRYTSNRLSQLVFDWKHNGNWSNPVFVEMVDHVLSNHVGPIYRFKLEHREFLDPSDIDRWIFHVSRNSVKEFILDIFQREPYKIPECLYSCQDITSLTLCGCLLDPPPTFRGFVSLKRIEFYYVSLAQDVFDNMLGYCPLLEVLILQCCDGFTHFRINAPKLQYLNFEGSFDDVTLKNISNLTDITISMCERSFAGGGSSNLVKFFSDLPRIRRLTIKNYFLKVFFYSVHEP